MTTTLDWYRLLGDLGIPWRDRGKNTSRKDINICCPFCGDDHGYHLGISLDRPTNYYCFRDPTVHSGHSYPRLLRALGCDNAAIGRILGDYGGAEARAIVSPPEPSILTNKWATFLPAMDSMPHLNYLRKRGFSYPESLCDRYDLRYAPVGKWAARILIPFKEQQEVVSWAGRDITDTLSLKMLMQENQHPGLLYIPLRPRKHAIIVEGQLDALKIAAAQTPYAPIAVSGKALTASKLLRLCILAPALQEILVCFDADVKLSTRIASIREIRAVMSSSVRVQEWPIPTGYKDPGEMPIYVIRRWLV